MGGDSLSDGIGGVVDDNTWSTKSVVSKPLPVEYLGNFLKNDTFRPILDDCLLNLRSSGNLFPINFSSTPKSKLAHPKN